MDDEINFHPTHQLALAPLTATPDHENIMVGFRFPLYTYAGEAVVFMVAIMLGVALLSLAATGLQVAPRCDRIEINHHIEDGKVVWTQAIAWDWSPQYRRHDAQAWVMIERYRIIPGGVVLYTPSGKTVEVRAGQLQETRSEIDPEVENRKVFPAEFRRKVW